MLDLEQSNKFPQLSEKKLDLLWKLRLLWDIMKGGEKEMAVIYATLIIRGARTFNSVPSTLKEKVRQVLIDLEMEELIVE